MAGASFNPNTKLNRKKYKQISTNEFAKPKQINAMTAGPTIYIRDFRRPNSSDKKPLIKLPNGCPINVHVAANKINLNFSFLCLFQY